MSMLVRIAKLIIHKPHRKVCTRWEDRAHGPTGRQSGTAQPFRASGAQEASAIMAITSDGTLSSHRGQTRWQFALPCNWDPRPSQTDVADPMIGDELRLV